MSRILVLGLGPSLEPPNSTVFSHYRPKCGRMIAVQIELTPVRPILLLLPALLPSLVVSWTHNDEVGGSSATKRIEILARWG